MIGIESMKRWILNGTFVLAIAVSPLDLGTSISNLGPVAVYAQSIDPAVREYYNSAKKAFHEKIHS